MEVNTGRAAACTLLRKGQRGPRDGNLRQQTWTAAGPAHAVARVFEAHTHSARSARLSSAGVLFHARLVLSAYHKLTILVVPKPFAGIFIMLE